jgi:hypothetical protein
LLIPLMKSDIANPSKYVSATMEVTSLILMCYSCDAGCVGYVAYAVGRGVRYGPRFDICL